MKKIILLLIPGIFIFGCERVDNNKSSFIAMQQLHGSYTGTFMTCGAGGCIIKDTGFSIIEESGKTYLQFGAVKDQISVENNAIHSVSVKIDTFNLNGTYGVNGNYKNDSVHLYINNRYLPKGIYKNSLDGKRQ